MLDNDPGNIAFRVVINFAKARLDDGHPLESDVRQLIISTGGSVDEHNFPMELAVPLWNAIDIASHDLAEEFSSNWFLGDQGLQLARRVLQHFPDSALAAGKVVDRLMSSVVIRTGQLLNQLK
jgi:hypothetical protein